MSSRTSTSAAKNRRRRADRLGSASVVIQVFDRRPARSERRQRRVQHVERRENRQPHSARLGQDRQRRHDGGRGIVENERGWSDGGDEELVVAGDADERDTSGVERERRTGKGL